MMIRRCFMVLLLMGIFTCESVQSQQKYRVYLGTYTGEGSEGIYQCELDLKDGSLSAAVLACKTTNPSFLAFHPTKNFLYACNESEATISSFAIDDHTGQLTFLNSQPSQGDAPCHLVIDPTGQNVLAANYTGGSCLCIPLETDGKLSAKSSLQEHPGPTKHGHSIHLDHANKYALCCDLGMDKVMIYSFDANRGLLKPHREFSMPQGSGPRHFAWHPGHQTAYINGETDLTVVACDYDADNGTLSQKQVLSTLPNDVVHNGGSTAETVVHPTGKFVYVSNRDPYNSIAIFAVDPQSQRLTAIGHQSRGVKTPRNFAIEPTGQYLLVANQTGDNVIVFRIDPSTGELTPTGSSVQVANPVCVKFREM